MARRKEIRFHPHGDCAKAHLIQYTGDPLLAKCTLDGEVHVASTLTPCMQFKHRLGESVIEKRKKRLGITDKFI